MEEKLKALFTVFSVPILFCSSAFSAELAPQSFTLDGTLLASDHVSPLLDSTAKVRVQVLNPSKTCVLYDEEQTVNTLSTNGHFNIQVGSAVGSAKRRALDSANAMARVYQNSSAIPAQAAPSQTCAGSSYTPVAGDVRYVRVIVTPTSSSPETLTPDMVLDSVPNAVVAQSLQGVEKSGFLQINPSVVLTQAKLEQFMQTLTTVPGMGVTYDGTNFQSYDPKNGSLLSSGSVTDTQISDVEWAKITSVPPAINAVATLSCANGEILKFVSGAWACATESGVGTESDPTVEAYAKHAPGAGLVVNGSNQLVPDFGTTAGKVAQGNDSRFTDSRAPSGGASGDLSGSYPNPTVAKLQGRGVSVTAPADGQVLRYDNGTSTWVPSNFGIADLKKSNGLSQFVSASCTSSQTLIWSAVTDDFSCTNISLPVAQVTGTLPIAQGGTGQTTAGTAINALLPSQGSNSGKFLTTNGTDTSWTTALTSESDPKVGANTTNYLSKWNGSALVASGVIESGGSVGIGTASPGSKLHVIDSSDTTVTAESTGGFSQFKASTSSAVMSLFAAPTAGGYGGLGTDTAHPVIFRTSNAERMRITSTGNVGIGVSSPLSLLSNSSTNRLDHLGTGLGTSALNWANSSAGYTAGFENAATGASTNGLLVKVADTSASANAFNVVAGSTSRFLVRADGNVGIGTASPSSKVGIVDSPTDSNKHDLRVEQYAKTTTDGTNYNRASSFEASKQIPSGVTDSGYMMGSWIHAFRNNIGTTGDSGTLAQMTGVSIAYGHYNADGTATPQTTNAYGISISPYYNTGTITNAYDLLLSAGTGGATITNRYAVYQASTSAKNYFAGNVGIGTAAPLARLHSLVGSSYGSSAVFSTSDFNNSNAGTALGIYAGAVSGSTTMRIQSTAAGVAAPLILNEYGGNIGIGTTAPTSTLHLASNSTTGTKIRLDSTDTGGHQFGITSTGSTNTTGAGYLLITDYTMNGNRLVIEPGGNIGIGTAIPDQLLSVNGNASKVGGGSWATFSDRRLKTIEGDFTRGLSAVLNLQPIYYHYNDGNPMGLPNEGPHVGFIAQEVKEQIPEAVTENKKGYLMLNNDPIIWSMFNAIKEFYAEFTNTREHMNQLESRNAALERENAAIKAYLCQKDASAPFCH